MSGLLRLARAELLMLRSARLLPLLAIAAGVLAAALVAVKIATTDTPDLRGEDGLRDVLSVVGVTGALTALVLGVLAVTGEARHGTIDRAALALPARWPELLVKLAVTGLAAALLGAVAVVTGFAVALPWMNGEDLGFALTDSVPVAVALGTLAACVLVGAAGVGLGAAFRDAPRALVVGVVWLVLLDVGIDALEPAVASWLPGGGVAALVRQPQDDLLPAGLAALVLAAHVALVGALGAWLLTRRDLT